MKLLTKKQILERIPYSGMHIDRLEKAGNFPKRLQIGPARVGWVEEEIDQWIQARIDARGGCDE